MALLGRAAVCSWNDVKPEGRDNMYEWHNREHLPERLGIPGFLRGRRFRSETAEPEFMFLYEARDMGVLGGADYFARLDNPTPWTSQSTKNFFNSYRSVFEIQYSAGVSMGGAILALRVVPADAERLRSELVENILPPIEPRVGITGVHFGISNQQISQRDTAEKRGRGAPFKMIGWVLLVEGVSADVLRQVRDEVLTDATLEASGAQAGSIEGGVYQLEICRLPQD